MLNRRERRLFVLDSGIRLSAMTPQVAHIVSTTQRNFTNPVRTTSGATLQIYRDSFDFEFANLSLRNRSNILEFDGTSIEQRTGLAIGGMLGFDMLHTMVLHLDYRDGLVKFESDEGESGPRGRATEVAGAGEEKPGCAHGEATDVPAAATIEARSTGLWESGHMKPGQRVTVKVVHSWVSPVCRLDEGSLLYGHITAASASKDPQGRAQLALAFDQADCFGGEKKTLPLKILSVVAAPGEFVGIHTAMPVAIGGGRTRSVGDAVSSQDGTMGDEENLNPEKIPGIVHPGTVRGLPKLELQSDGGPGCSALLTTAERSLHLGPQTKFVIVLQDVVKP